MFHKLFGVLGAIFGFALAAQAAVWQPAPGTTWQIQLGGGAPDLSVDAQVFDIDYQTDASAVTTLHAKGVKVIAYIDAGSWENYRPDAASYPAAVLGAVMDGWPDERWVDIRRLDVLGPILQARVNEAKAKGFDAIDFDNVDGYTNHTGLSLTADDQLKFNRFIASMAHAAGMSVGLKNDLDQVEDLVGDFDFEVNEQSFQYHEAKKLKPFIAAGKAVFEIEYKLELDQFCPEAKRLGFSALKKKLSLNAWRKVCE